MKLRNKKTGEIVEWFNNTDGIFPNTLAELNEEWEDAPEEPKEYWYIDSACDGDIDRAEIFDCEHCKRIDEFNKSIGNYFETKEEAEKTVEKLKAYKRLKDEYGFKFTGWERDEQYRGDFIITAQDWNTSDDKLLDLLFGGEE